MGEAEGNKGKEDELVEEADAEWEGEFEDAGKVLFPKAEAQGKHDERQNEREENFDDHGEPGGGLLLGFVLGEGVDEGLEIAVGGAVDGEGVEDGVATLFEVGEALEGDGGGGIVEVGEPVEGVDFFHDDEVFHEEENLAVFVGVDEFEVPVEVATVAFAEVGGGEVSGDFFAEGGEVASHAA